MRAKLGHAAAKRGDCSIVDRAEFGQQGGGGGERARRRRVGEWQIGGRGAPGEAIQQQPGQFGFEDFWSVKRWQATMEGRRPDPDRDPWCLPPGPPGALFGGGAADPLGREPRKPGRGIHPWRPAPAAIDDDAHARYGQGCFGD